MFDGIDLWGGYSNHITHFYYDFGLNPRKFKRNPLCTMSLCMLVHKNQKKSNAKPSKSGVDLTLFDSLYFAFCLN